MGSYIQGNEVTLFEQFLDVDGQPADPTTVTFYVRSPAGSVTAYVYGVDPEVVRTTNDVPDSPYFGATDGFYLCNLGPVDMAGIWPYRPSGTGAVVVANEYEFEIEPSSTIAPVTSGPQFGPWVLWCDPQDVIESCPGAEGSDTGLLDSYCLAASQVLFEMGGRQHPGLSQPTTVRPGSTQCGCWPWNETWHSWGQVQWGYWTWDWGLGSWWGCGPTNNKWSGCEAVSKVELDGYARSIVEVKIGGDVVDPSLYRLDENKFLVRMRDPSNPNVNTFWPGCQIQNLPDTEPGTFAVTYRYGIDPPQIAVDAAADLACQLWRARRGGDCQLPVGVTRAVRKGLTIERSLFGQWKKGKGQPWSVGIPSVDTYLNAYNPNGIRRRATVFSPWSEPRPLKPGV